MSKMTIRLLSPEPYDTLHGYVFASFAHARQWLTQTFVSEAGYKLETVEAGEPCQCRTCGRLGFTQTVKCVGNLTVRAFLAGNAGE